MRRSFVHARLPGREIRRWRRAARGRARIRTVIFDRSRGTRRRYPCARGLCSTLVTARAKSRRTHGEVAMAQVAGHEQSSPSPLVRENQEDHRDPESDRDPEALVRGIPAGGRGVRERAGHGTAGGFQVGLSDQGLQRDRVARIRQLRARRAQVRRRGMPSARHDLRRAAQGHHPARHLGRRERPPLDQERQGAGSLLRRDSADDRQRHLHGQRHRAGHRLAAPSLARRVLRARQGPHPFDRQAALLGAHHPVSRVLDRFRVRSRATSSTCASTGGASSTPRCCCARSG